MNSEIKRNLNTCLSFYCIIFILSRYMHCILFYLDTYTVYYSYKRAQSYEDTDRQITVVQAWSFVLMVDEGGGGQIYPQHFRKQKNKTTSLTLDILIRWSVHMVASYYLKKCLHSPRKWRGLFVENFCKYDLKKKKRLINLEKHAMIVWSRNETNDLHRWRCTGHPMNISVMLLLYTRYIST